MHRVEGPRRWRVRVEYLDELVCAKHFDGARSPWNSGNAEPSHRGLNGEPDTVDDEASAHRDLRGTTARAERPKAPQRERRGEDALVPTQIAWGTWSSMAAERLATRI